MYIDITLIRFEARSYPSLSSNPWLVRGPVPAWLQASTLHFNGQCLLILPRANLVLVARLHFYSFVPSRSSFRCRANCFVRKKIETIVLLPLVSPKRFLSWSTCRVFIFRCWKRVARLSFVSISVSRFNVDDSLSGAISTIVDLWFVRCIGWTTHGTQPWKVSSSHDVSIEKKKKYYII